MSKPLESIQRYPNISCCPRDCPNRSPTCHNVNTCETWKKHEEEKAKYYEKRKTDSEMNDALNTNRRVRYRRVKSGYEVC